ncbi:MAG: hypothetical protein NC332_04215, partial [Firmicutes bacterium]|nr:hypothetical protein [Bacillota bacterium]
MQFKNRVNHEAVQRTCPNCGASLRFNPKDGKLYCEHCKSSLDFGNSREVRERDFKELMEFDTWDESKVSYYRCKNCGASTVLSRTTLATSCPYCASPVVLDERKTGLVRPDSLVPFELTEEQAEAQLKLWKKRKLYAPNSFRKNGKSHGIKGVYTPAWTFDFATVSQYDGRLGKTCTRTVRRNGKSYTETYVKWFSVNGTTEKHFDDIFVSGNSHVSAKDFRQLNLTNQAKYVVYNDGFLAGYIADNYTVSPEDAYRAARKQADNAIYNDIMSYYGADHDGGLTVKTTEISRSFKYMMLPMYVATDKHRGKVYRQYVSGVYCDSEKSKAKVCGKSPVSVWKVIVTVLAGLGVIAGITALILHSLDAWSFGFGGWEFYFTS